MTDDMQRCPHCGAYVMSNDDYCPRCDHRLDGLSESGPETPTRDEPDRADRITDVVDAVRAEDEVAAPADVSDHTGDAGNAIDTGNAVDADAAGNTGEADLGDHVDQVDHVGDAADAGHTESPRKHAPPARPIFAPSDESKEDDTDEIETLPDSPDSSKSIESTEPPGSAGPVDPEGVTDAVEVAFDDAEAIHDLDQGDAAERESETDDAIALEADSARDSTPDDDSDLMDLTHPAIRLQAQRYARRYIVPPAPYTPPPPVYAAPPAYAPSPPTAFLQQRVDDYRRGGYHLLSHRPGEAILSYGKGLGVGGWFMALVSVVGALWYVLLLALSGFQRDHVYIVLESDGYVYEDGPGAAHVRRHRSRVGRRWAAFGLVIVFVCVLLAIGLGIVAGIVLTQERYQAALREAYPAVTLFEEQFSATEAAPDDVRLAKDGAVAFSILGGIALVGLWGGATLFVIGSIHASAYQVHVSALPGWD